MTYSYDGSQVLFRQAKARAIAARRFAQQADQAEAIGSSGMERRQRERDAVISAIVLTQAAAESYANWVHIQADVTPPRTWIERWKHLPTAARALGRPAQTTTDAGPVEITLSDEQEELLKELGAWRNFLLHADARARDRLRELLDLASEQTEVDLLTADLAESLVGRAEELFRWAQRLTGINAPFLDHAWVAPDEC